MRGSRTKVRKDMQTQSRFSFDAVREVYEERQAETIAERKLDKSLLIVAGDARYDSVGFSANRCTYS